MSRVSNVILYHSIVEEQESEDGPYLPVVSLNRTLRAQYQTEFVKVDQHAGGYKAFEADVYLAAFNHAETEELLELIKHQAWEYPAEVQVFVLEEEDEHFKEHRIA